MSIAVIVLALLGVMVIAHLYLSQDDDDSDWFV